MSKELVTTGSYDVSIAREAAALWQEELGSDYTPTFPRLKVPSGGGTTWEDPFSADPESPDQMKEFVGVIVGKRKTSRLYLTPFDERDADDSGRPDAWSIDGKTQIVPHATIEKLAQMNAERAASGIAPLPTPSRTLATCPYSQFGSAALLGGKGKGKATNDYLELYLYADGKPLPVQLSVPAGSIASAVKHLQNIVGQAKPLSSVETVVTLRKKQSGQGITFSEVLFVVGRQLDADLASTLKGYEIELAPILTADPFSDHAVEDTDGDAIEGVVMQNAPAEQAQQATVIDDAVAAVGAAFNAEPVAVAAGDIDL